MGENENIVAYTQAPGITWYGVEADETEQNAKQTLHKYNMIANKNI